HGGSEKRAAALWLGRRPVRAEVAEDVVAGKRRQGRPSIHVAADDRDPDVGMAVLDDRPHERIASATRRRARPGRSQRRIDRDAVTTLPDPPAVVAAAYHDVDFLEPTLADVADDESSLASRFPGEAPRVAEAVGVDLGSTATGRERVVARDGV